MPSFAFAFLADCQLGCYATFSGFSAKEAALYAERGMKVRVVPKVDGYEWDAARYRAAIEAVNRARPAFVAFGGDMVDDPVDDGQHEEFMRITKELDAEIPIYLAPGNHDAGENALKATAKSLAKYRELFGPDYYTFEHLGARFFVLNTTMLDHPHEVADEAEAQLTFLAEQLGEAYSRGEGPLVLIGHHPLFLATPDEPDTYWNLSGAYRYRILELIHRFGVVAAFSGHIHRNSVARDGGFEMVTSGPVGYPLGDDPSGYRIVQVYPDRIEHTYHSLGLDTGED